MLNTSITSFLLMVCAGVSAGQATDHDELDHGGHTSAMSGAERQAEIARRSKDVMPFSLAATNHVFTKTPEGGIQQVVARQPADTKQVRLVRQHLQEIRDQFLAGNFSGPTQIHGQEMPGLAELTAAKAGRIAIAYKEVRGGAELTYNTVDDGLVAALHAWFDAQLSDHGKDAIAGHVHPGSVKKK